MGGMMQMPTQPMSYPIPSMAIMPLPQIDLQQLDQMQSADDRRSFVGNAVFPLINAVCGPASSKVTGMVIDESAVDVKKLLSDQSFFNTKVQEALQLLQSQGQAQ